MCGEAHPSSREPMNAARLSLILSFVALSGCIRTHGGDGGIGARAGSGGALGGTAGSGGSSSGGSGTGGSAGTALSAGRAGTVAMSGRGGTGGTSGFGGTGVAGTGSEELSCRERASRSAGLTRLSDRCFACTCDARPSSTVSCDRDCWRVIECVLTSGCASSDVVCIRAACVGPLGGAERFTAAVGLVVAVPISSCMAECSIPFDDPFDAGQ